MLTLVPSGQSMQYSISPSSEDDDDDDEEDDDEDDDEEEDDEEEDEEDDDDDFSWLTTSFSSLSASLCSSTGVPQAAASTTTTRNNPKHFMISHTKVDYKFSQNIFLKCLYKTIFCCYAKSCLGRSFIYVIDAVIYYAAFA